MKRTEHLGWRVDGHEQHHGDAQDSMLDVMRGVRAVEPVHVVPVVLRRIFNASCGHTGDHGGYVANKEIVFREMNGNVNVLMHEVFFIAADLILDALPRTVSQGHVGAEEEVVLAACQLQNELADLVISFEAKPSQRHIAIDHGSRGCHDFGILESLRHPLYPVGLQNTVGINAPVDVAGSDIKAVVTSGNQSLICFVAGQNDVCIWILELYLADNLRSRVRGLVVHHHNFVGRNGLKDRGNEALPNAVLFVVRGNDDGDRGRRRHTTNLTAQKAASRFNMNQLAALRSRVSKN